METRRCSFSFAGGATTSMDCTRESVSEPDAEGRGVGEWYSGGGKGAGTEKSPAPKSTSMSSPFVAESVISSRTSSMNALTFLSSLASGSSCNSTCRYTTSFARMFQTISPPSISPFRTSIVSQYLSIMSTKTSLCVGTSLTISIVSCSASNITCRVKGLAAVEHRHGSSVLERIRVH